MGLKHLLNSGLGMCQGSHRKPGSHWNSPQSTLSALPWEQASTLMLLTNGVQASHSPPVSSSGPPASQGGFPALCWIPGLGHPICGSNCSVIRADLHWCILPFPMSPLLEVWSQPDCSVPFLPDSVWIFVTALVVLFLTVSS